MYRCFGSAAANMLSQQVSYYEQLVCRFRGCYAAKLAALPDHQGEFLFPRQSITDCRKLGMSLQVYHGERQEIGCVVVLREVESTGGCQCAPQSISIIKVQILVFHRCLVRVQAVIVDPVLASCCGASFERTAAEARAANDGMAAAAPAEDP